MAKTKTPENKKRSSSPNKDLEAAIANDDGRSFEGKSDGSQTTRICYNRACPDYRRPRTGIENCGCKKTFVGGDRT